VVRGVRIKDHWKEQRLFEQRALLSGAALALLTLTLCVRLYILQVSRFDYYAQLSQGNRVRIEPIPAARGLILDRNGVLMAGGQPAYQLELVREEVPDLNATLKGLVDIGMIASDEVAEVRKAILSRRGFDSVPIRLRMSDEDVARFAVRRFEFPGVDIKTRQTRSYPYGEVGVHALGYVGAISESDLPRIDTAAYAGTTLIGKLGVESSYENELHGTNGYREILVNAEGRSVDKLGAVAPQLHTEAPTAGQDLILSIDMKAQVAAEQALGDRRGAVVALDPTNGDVLALASRPGFDPTLFGRGLTRAEYASLAENSNKPLLNRALRGRYPSGSTIKPVLALIALTDNVITADRKVLCTGEFHLPGSRHMFRADKDEPRGWLDLSEAISRSSDVYFYGLASTMGIDRIAAGLAPFGYGKVTGIDISGELAGLLPTPAWKKASFKRSEEQVWVPGDTVNLGVGQGFLLVTPLQLAHVAAILSQQGRNFRPRLVVGLRDSDGHVRRIAPIEGERVSGITQANWNTVLNAMIGTTSCGHYCGTAWRQFTGSAYTAAGKTGTAQVYTVAQNAKYNASATPETMRDHAWFIAFAPAEAPRIAVAVLVENAGFGAGAAAPVARRVMDAYLLDASGKLKPADAPPEPPPAPGEMLVSQTPGAQPAHP